MNTQKETSHTDISLDASPHNHQESMRDTHKERWLQKYAYRILMVWSHWQTPLGVAGVYMHKIKRDLGRFYDDPLKRMFIEATYFTHSDSFSCDARPAKEIFALD
jgi:hypothetical protein